MKDCCFIVNPFARRVMRSRLAHALEPAADGAKIVFTKAAGDATRLARMAAADGFQTVVAVGGDGTVNEVLAGIAGSDVRLGVIPAGTMNVFARELGLPTSWQMALERIKTGREQALDLAWANGRPFVQLAGVGFDADVVENVTSEDKRALGALAYVVSGLEELGTHRQNLRVEADGIPAMEGEWVLVGQGRFYGGPLALFPNANNADGLLDVIVVRRLSIPFLIKSALLLPFKLHTRIHGASYFQTRSLRVSGGARLQLDGESFEKGDFEFRVTPKALRVVV